MTEQEWLEGGDAHEMLCFLLGAPGNWMWAYCRSPSGSRKLRLFACASCRRVEHLLTDKRSQQAIEALERFCESQLSEEELTLAAKAARDAVQGTRDWLRYFASKAPDVAAGGIHATVVSGSGWHSARNALWHARQAVSLSAGSDAVAGELRSQSELLREIFGNPFRPVALDSYWLTPDVSALAQAIYDERRFADMPILADALEEAGCTNEDILQHCRTTSEHVRGCWVVDLLLARK